MSTVQPHPTSLTLVLLSDTHGLHREIDAPSGHILLHAGDFSDLDHSRESIEDFNAWLGELPHRHKLVVPGNHDFLLGSASSRQALLSNAIVLVNEAIEIDGLRIWGSPFLPPDGSIPGLNSAEDRRRLYRQIPGNTDVLITHGPPYGILDTPPESVLHSGCRELLNAVMRIRPKLHLFGHIHAGYGLHQTEPTLFVNAALLGPDGDLANPAIVVRMARSDAKR